MTTETAPAAAPLWTIVGIGVARVFARVFPTSWLLAGGRLAAPLMYVVMPGTRRALLENAGRILGSSSKARRRRNAIAVLESFSRFTLETLTSRHRPPVDEALFENMRGKEHFIQAQSLGRGLIATTLHLGNYQAGPLLLSRLHRPSAVVIKRDPIRMFEEERARLHESHGIREITVNGSAFFGVEALSVLREGGVVMIAPDVGFDSRAGSLYPFFGADAPFLPWPAQLALASQSPIVPCFVVRDGEGRYRLEISEPIVPGEGEQCDAIMTRLVKVFEDVVRRYPDQWLIIHRYWPG